MIRIIILSTLAAIAVLSAIVLVHVQGIMFYIDYKEKFGIFAMIGFDVFLLLMIIGSILLSQGI